MSETSTDHLLECIVEALQTFAFIAVEPPVEALPCPTEAELYTLRFGGPGAGEFQLATSPQLGCLMAANLMGLEPSDPQVSAAAQDVVKELCNIITGLWLRHRPPEETPEMGLPAVVTLADWNHFASQPGGISVLAEGLPMIVRMEDIA